MSDIREQIAPRVKQIRAEIDETRQGEKVGGTVMQPTENRSQDPGQALKAGTTAPEFTLSSSPKETLKLSDLRGKPVILAFYPADWSPVCGDQMALYNEVLPEFQSFNAELLGISVDGVWCHQAFRQQRNLRFPLLSDFEPKGEVARAYGVYRDGEGVTERALFVIDSEGGIAWSYVSPISVNPGADGILNALENLSGREVPNVDRRNGDEGKTQSVGR